jgi:hypothetical protein
VFTVRYELVAYFTQAVIRLPLTADPRARSQAVQRDYYCCGQSGTGTVVCPAYLGFSVLASFYRRCVLIHVTDAV